MAELHEAIAVLGGGCFWCMEAVFLDLRGVRRVKSGYAGGHVEHPTYKQVCGGQTGHAEVVRIAYDPSQIDYTDLLRVFFATHDPTTRDRQGNDVGPQYRSVILTGNEAETELARAVIAEITDSGSFDAPIVTRIVPLTEFWPAEIEHDNYFNRNPWSGYCQAVVAPKVHKFRKVHGDRLKARAA